MQARAAQTFQDEEPARKVGINDDTLSANLHEEAGVANEGDPEFSIDSQTRLVSFTTPRRHGGATHQTSELGGAFAKGRIAKRLLDHPATEREGPPEGSTGSTLSCFMIIP